MKYILVKASTVAALVELLGKHRVVSNAFETDEAIVHLTNAYQNLKKAYQTQDNHINTQILARQFKDLNALKNLLQELTLEANSMGVHLKAIPGIEEDIVRLENEITSTLTLLLNEEKTND